MFTLEDTLLGYIADDLRWCGDPSTSGKDLNHLGWLWVNGKGSLSWARERPVGIYLMTSVTLATSWALTKQNKINHCPLEISALGFRIALDL